MEEPTGIRLFDDRACSFRQVSLDDVDGHLSNKSEFTATEMERRVKANGDERYRLRALVNAELINVLLGILENEENEAELFELLAESPQAVEEDMEQIKEIVDEITGA